MTCEEFAALMKTPPWLASNAERLAVVRHRRTCRACREKMRKAAAGNPISPEDRAKVEIAVQETKRAERIDPELQ